MSDRFSIKASGLRSGIKGLNNEIVYADPSGTFDLIFLYSFIWIRCTQFDASAVRYLTAWTLG